jgi:alpha-ketoglutarate-dependent taurine dioxygenase
MAQPYYEGPRRALAQTVAQNRVEVLAVLRVMPGLSDSARQALIAHVKSEDVAVFRHQETGEWWVWEEGHTGALDASQSLAAWYAQWFAQQQDDHTTR